MSTKMIDSRTHHVASIRLTYPPGSLYRQKPKRDWSRATKLSLILVGTLAVDSIGLFLVIGVVRAIARHF